jgi:hypothetical protein
MNCQRFRVTLNLYFEYGLEDWCFQDKEEFPDEINEPELTNEEIDTFMKGSISSYYDNSKVPRYMLYAKNIINSFSILSESQPLESMTDVTYENCTLTFEIETINSMVITCDDIKNHILRDSFEDGMMEGELNNEILVSTKNKYRVKKYKEEGYDESYIELGHIECRNSRCVNVELID